MVSGLIWKTITLGTAAVRSTRRGGERNQGAFQNSPAIA